MSTGLGRGLSSLIPNKKFAKSLISEDNKSALLEDMPNRIVDIETQRITANPMQPRQIFDHQDLEDLIESIKVHGIIQPLIVTRVGDDYQLIAGERRWRSAKVIGMKTVPTIVRKVEEQEKLELAIIENVQRKNLNPIEKAFAYQKLVDEFNLTQDEVADKMGISRSSVANTIRFMILPEEIQKALAEERITEGHAKVIAGLKDEKKQLEFLEKIEKYSFTVRDAESEGRKMSKKKLFRARTIKDPMLEGREEKLRETLETKVIIKGQAKKGQIVIDYFSEEELDSIINKIV